MVSGSWIDSGRRRGEEGVGHPWESTGERRTVVWGQGQPEEVMQYLNGWPCRLYQSMAEYKSPNRTVYVSPRGTSSERPVCGGRLEHPVWAVSRCVKCGVDYGRDRLASLAILCRGLRLCGQPFAVSADASWKASRDEYLYTDGTPGAIGAGWTEPSSAPNPGACAKVHV
jgi:hypothetical protein